MPRSLLQKPLVYAHRGGAALRPENTLAAFDHGLSLGADGLELDVHLTRDGVVIVHHDPELARTTDGSGRIRDYTADELASLDAGYAFAAPDGGFPYRGTGLRIPRLSEVLARYPGIPMIIELKDPDPALATQVIADVRAAKAVDTVALGSFYYRVLKAARALEPADRTGAAREETRWALYRSWVGWPLSRPAYHEFQVPESSGRTTIVSPGFVDYAHRAGAAVKVWTVNRQEDMERLLGWGVDAIISDHPDVAVRVRDRHLSTVPTP